MINERIQVLLTSDQRRRLQEAAQQQGRSVGSLVREAVDARFGTPSREERIAAFEAIEAMEKVSLPEPAELRRLIDESHEDEILQGLTLPPR